MARPVHAFGSALEFEILKFYKTKPTTDRQAVNKIEINVCSANFGLIFRKNLF